MLLPRSHGYARSVLLLLLLLLLQSACVGLHVATTARVSSCVSDWEVCVRWLIVAAGADDQSDHTVIDIMPEISEITKVSMTTINTPLLTYLLTYVMNEVDGLIGCQLKISTSFRLMLSILHLPLPGEGAECFNVRDCMSVCLSAGTHISETTGPHTSPHFLCCLPLAVARSSWQYVVYFRFSATRDENQYTISMSCCRKISRYTVLSSEYLHCII